MGVQGTASLLAGSLHSAVRAERALSTTMQARRPMPTHATKALHHDQRLGSLRAWAPGSAMRPLSHWGAPLPPEEKMPANLCGSNRSFASCCSAKPRQVAGKLPRRRVQCMFNKVRNLLRNQFCSMHALYDILTWFPGQSKAQHRDEQALVGFLGLPGRDEQEVMAPQAQTFVAIKQEVWDRPGSRCHPPAGSTPRPAAASSLEALRALLLRSATPPQSG